MGSICLAAEHSICLPVCRVNEGILVPDLPNIIIMMYSSGNTDKSDKSRRFGHNLEPVLNQNQFLKPNACKAATLVVIS
ncbi:hypothetical protein F2P81_007352 [Scophthalmus maximus]|uniref:Uncharacterized protein n=1 Tax=Scophthalmus maximus TaxID=52904 RepID=A0A6A4TE29_SCOMX|nr:hypothetical protein F2P81_007352 [Scophthalmus maximus]